MQIPPPDVIKQAQELIDAGKFNEALAFCESIAPLYEAQEAWEEWVQISNMQNYCLVRIGKSKEAVPNCQVTLDRAITHLGKSHPYTLESHNQIAICFGQQGNYDHALIYFKELLSLSAEKFGKNDVNMVKRYTNIGHTYALKGDYQLAISFNKQALSIQQQNPNYNKLNLVTIYTNLGNYSAIIGDFDLGLFYLKQGLAINVELLGTHPNLINSYQMLAGGYKMAADYDNAIIQYQQALNIAQNFFDPNHPTISDILGQISICYSYLNDHEKANHYMADYLKIISHNNTYLHTEETYEYMGLIYFNQKDYPNALLYYQKTLPIRLKNLGVFNNITAASYINIGECYNMLNNYPEALQHYQLALQSLNLPVSDTNFYALPTLKNYTHAYFLLETLRGKAIVFYNMYKQDNLPQNLIASLAHYHCADALIAQMRQSYKAEGSKLTLGSTGKNNIYQPAIDRTWLAYQQETQNNLSVAQIAAQMGYQLPTTIELAFMFSEKSQAMLFFTNLKNEEAKATAQLPEQLRQQEYQLRVELNYLDTKIAEGNQDHEQVQKWQKQYFDYKQQYNQLIEIFEKEYPDYYQIKYDNQIVTIEQIQRQLPTNAALIEYFVSNEQLYVFCITPKNSHFIALNTNPTTLNTAIEALLKNITNSRPTVGGRNAFANASHQLYQLVFEPIVSYLPPNCQQLIIIPTNNLSQLPFEALLTNAVANGTHYHNMPYLGTQYAIQYHYSATLWHYGSTKQKTTYAQPNAAQGSYLGFAPVVYNTAETNDSTEIKKEIVQLRGLDYVALPHTETEVQEVSKLLAQKGYQSDVYLRKNATVEQFKNTLQQYPNLQFLHIAAHGLFNANNPQLSGIVFSPNTNEEVLTDTAEQPVAATKRDIAEQYGTMLYMGDTYQLNLKNVQLVVLSCCDTGVGKMAWGEGMMAINRGFLYAGAQNVVFTLFKIPDQQSNLLVQALFKYLLSGQAYASALKNAKQEILTQPNIRPIHWAGFVLLGNNIK